MHKYLVLFFFVFSTVFAFSTNPVQTDGVRGNFDLGLNYSQNVDKTLQINNVFLLSYKIGNSNFSLGNNISFISKTGEDELLNKGTQDFKYSYKSKKLGADVSLQNLYDISRSIKKRWVCGLGISYAFLQDDDKRLSIGLSGLKEKETSIQGDDKMQNRISTNLEFSYKINRNVEIIGANHYQPNVEEIGDFRMKSMLALRIVISPHFLLSINNTFNYDSFPVEGVPEIDYQLINSISYTF
ncbi:MAG: DUF481 domain-containing protein [Bacteroidota bacterium]|nr:DUF481 domain-containing protein [Bacteroidota bacterium]